MKYFVSPSLASNLAPKMGHRQLARSSTSVASVLRYQLCYSEKKSAVFLQIKLGIFKLTIRRVSIVSAFVSCQEKDHYRVVSVG